MHRTLLLVWDTETARIRREQSTLTDLKRISKAMLLPYTMKAVQNLYPTPMTLGVSRQHQHQLTITAANRQLHSIILSDTVAITMILNLDSIISIVDIMTLKRVDLLARMGM